MHQHSQFNVGQLKVVGWAYNIFRRRVSEGTWVGASGSWLVEHVAEHSHKHTWKEEGKGNRHSAEKVAR